MKYVCVDVRRAGSTAETECQYECYVDLVMKQTSVSDLERSDARALNILVILVLHLHAL